MTESFLNDCFRPEAVIRSELPGDSFRLIADAQAEVGERPPRFRADGKEHHWDAFPNVKN